MSYIYVFDNNLLCVNLLIYVHVHRVISSVDNVFRTVLKLLSDVVEIR